MPQGDKSAYTTKQKRQARHIEESYKQRGLTPAKAAARAWATVNKQDHGGKLSGAGRAKPGKAASAKSRGKTGVKTAGKHGA